MSFRKQSISLQITKLYFLSHQHASEYICGSAIALLYKYHRVYTHFCYLYPLSRPIKSGSLQEMTV